MENKYEKFCFDIINKARANLNIEPICEQEFYNLDFDFIDAHSIISTYLDMLHNNFKENK